MAVLDAAVLDAIKLQRDAGVDVITDGELRRLELGGHAGLPRLLRWPWRPASTRSPATPAACAGAAARTARRAATRRPTTPSPAGCRPPSGSATARPSTPSSPGTRAPGPSSPCPPRATTAGTGGPGRSPAAYGSAEEYLTEIRDYLRAVVDQVVASAATTSSSTRPTTGRCATRTTAPPWRRRDATRRGDRVRRRPRQLAVHRAERGHPGAARLPRQRPGGRWHSAGGYGAISAELFPRLASTGCCSSTTPTGPAGSGRCDDVRRLRGVLGLLTTKSASWRTTRRARADRRGGPLQAARRARALHPVRVRVRPVGNPVTPVEQRAKLELVVRLARRAGASRRRSAPPLAGKRSRQAG